ncbi:MAG: hypothetical protein O7J95_07050, partial [Planctomycetota bacterium]|nr:hypothetical protein [Planctomycetota bacterium]
PRVLFAVTSHGFGHVTRSLAIARELAAVAPETDLVISTGVSASRVERELECPFTHRERDYEPGAAQKNCFEVDIVATRDAYRRFDAQRAGRLADEERFLRESGCTGVVSDSPALPLRAAANVGIPAVGVSNFTWDWILEPLVDSSDLEAIRRRVAEDYAAGDLYLRLPLGPQANPFPVGEDAPLVARAAKRPPEAVRRQLLEIGGLEARALEGRKLVLVCPGGWGPAGWDRFHVRDCEGFLFLLVGGLPVTASAPLLHLPRDLPPGLEFPERVNAADLVLSKLGYGIVSECLLHRTLLVAVERRDFRETGEMLPELRSMAPLGEMSLAAFFSGEWEESLIGAAECDTRWADVPANGARLVAERLAAFFQLDTVGGRNVVHS